jgi:hypothetical protein
MISIVCETYRNCSRHVLGGRDGDGGGDGRQLYRNILIDNEVEG